MKKWRKNNNNNIVHTIYKNIFINTRELYIAAANNTYVCMNE